MDLHEQVGQQPHELPPYLGCLLGPARQPDARLRLARIVKEFPRRG
jgi:hypothetical protein